MKKAAIKLVITSVLLLALILPIGMFATETAEEAPKTADGTKEAQSDKKDEKEPEERLDWTIGVLPEDYYTAEYHGVLVINEPNYRFNEDVIIPENYGRPGEDRPLTVYDRSVRNHVEIPYDELDDILRDAVTLGYRMTQNSKDTGPLTAMRGNVRDIINNYMWSADFEHAPTADELCADATDIVYGKVVGISSYFGETLGQWGSGIIRRTYRKFFRTIYEIEVGESYVGSASGRIKIAVEGGHATYNTEYQAERAKQIGWTGDVPVYEETNLSIGENYLFVINRNHYNVSYYAGEDGYGKRVYRFAFKPSELPVPSDSEPSYENIMAWIGKKK